jgi:pimeloyl-ACP methyl ester carboxylesterase
VSVERVDARRVHRDLTANVLSAGRPSAESVRVLYVNDLTDRFEGDPVTTLAQMHQSLPPRGAQDLLFALAELSFLHGDRSGDLRYYAAAAVYAYAFLFPGDPETPLEPLDPRVRVAANLYNRGLTEGLEFGEPGTVSLQRPGLALPFGELLLELDPRELQWGDFRLVDFQAAADLEVRGLRNRFRRPGIGAPLLARIEPADPDRPLAPGSRRVARRIRVAATAFVRIEDVRRGLESGRLRGRVELYVADEGDEVRIAGRQVPLESEFSSALASSLANPAIWQFELAGFFSGDFGLRTAPVGGLVTLHPHRRGQIPVVLVHGTASSPGRWGQLVNDLAQDPVLRQKYEVWLFFYNTGNPIAYSAGLLREALSEAVEELDPEGRDPALRKMVLIGHSQGGLLTRMTVIETGDALWQVVTPEPFEEMELSDEGREILRRSLFLEPLPFVDRVVFIATPHRGSFLAAWRLSGIVKRFTRTSSRLATLVPDLVRNAPDTAARRRFDRLPTSIDNMTPNSSFIRALSEIPITDDVAVHSIIPVKGSGPLAKRNDGVVAYKSAHLDSADSELVIQSGHSVQGHPRAVAEVNRILHLHLDSR